MNISIPSTRRNIRILYLYCHDQTCLKFCHSRKPREQRTQKLFQIALEIQLILDLAFKTMFSGSVLCQQFCCSVCRNRVVNNSSPHGTAIRHASGRSPPPSPNPSTPSFPCQHFYWLINTTEQVNSCASWCVVVNVNDRLRSRGAEKLLVHCENACYLTKTTEEFTLSLLMFTKLTVCLLTTHPSAPPTLPTLIVRSSISC